MTTEDSQTPKDRLNNLGTGQVYQLVESWQNQEDIVRACRAAGTLEAVIKQMILLEEQRRTHWSTSECLEDWREKRWGSQVEQTFIANRRRLEAASFWRLVTPSKGVAMEAYYRLCNRETTFEVLAEACKLSGETGVSADGDILPLASVNLVEKKLLIRLEKNLATALRNSSPGVTRPPMRQKNKFIVVQLRELHAPRLDQDVRQGILLEIQNAWLEKELELRLLRINKAEVKQP